MSHQLKHFVTRATLLVFLLSTLPAWAGAAVAARAPATHDLPREISNKRNDRPVELAERRTPASQTFQNPDGTLSTSIYAKPLHYRDQSGRYQPIQNVLVAEPGGDTLRNAANRYKASFKRQLGLEFMTFEYAGHTLAMDLEGARLQTAAWQSNKLSYAEVFDNVDLVYTTGNDYVKEEIILKAPQPAPQFTFGMRLKGVEAEQMPGGEIRFVDERTGITQWSIPPFYMVDRVGNLSAAVSVTLHQTGANTRLEVVPDAGWLADPARVYPVVIDPTIALQPDYVSGLDTTIADGEGLQNLNLGFDSALSAGSRYSSLLKFDLTAIPRASIVSKATLRLNGISGLPSINSTGITAPVAAPTLTASSLTSAFRAGTYSVAFTYVTPQGETVPSPAGTVSINDYQAIAVHTGALPAGVTGIKIYAGAAGLERLAATSDLVDVTLTAPPAPGAPGVPIVPTEPPALTVATQSGSISSGTWSVVYTYVTARGETQASPAATIDVPGGRAVTVNVGTFPPGVTQAEIYIGQPNNELYSISLTQPSGNITSLPAASAPRPPEPAAGHIATPVTPPAAVAAAAPAGTTGFLGGAYSVWYAWVNSMGQTTPSPVQTVSLADGQALKVTVPRMPSGVTSANVFVGTGAATGYRLGNIPAVSGGVAVTFGAPPAGLFTPAPAQILALIPNPTVLPSVDPIAGTTAFVEGSYDVAYTFFGPNGESAASPAKQVTLQAGDSVKVTAGHSIPTDATGMRVYMGNHGGPLYLVGTLSATQAGSNLPVLEIKAPVGYKPVQPPTSSNYSIPSTPTLRATNLSTPTRLEGALYYVAYSWVYPDQESRASPVSSVTIVDGQGIDVVGGTLPDDALGMRVYMGRKDKNLSLVATSMGSRTQIEGDRYAPLAPVANTTDPPAPSAEVITMSSLPAGTYHVAYTLTTPTSESAPSPVGTATIQQGRS